MRFLHISDLHLGRQIGGFDLYEEQSFMLESICGAAKEKSVDAVIIAGDIYDKQSPAADAMTLFSDFTGKLVNEKIPVYMISGNHDSAGRVSYFSDIIRESGVFVSEKFDGRLQKHIFRDEYGNVNIYLLPFLKPAAVRQFYPDSKIETYEDAVSAVIGESNINSKERNVLVCHQFIAGSEKSGSEVMSVGGTPNISARVFDSFDYVALGHIHRPQSAGRETVRYSGSPMKYDASEASQTKKLTFVDIEEKGKIKISMEDMPYLRDVISVSGKFGELMARSECGDYAAVTITDEDIVPDAAASLRQVYPLMISFGVKNSKTDSVFETSGEVSFEGKSPVELFFDFFKEQNNGAEPDEYQMEIMKKVFGESGGEGI